MLFLITEILVSLLVAAALGALVAWLAKDLLARQERRQLEEGWQGQLRDSEARAGTFKNQLAEAKHTEESLRARFEQLEEQAAARPAEDASPEAVAALEADLARRDKKIELLKLQIAQSETSLTSEWDSLKALKTEVAERQRRLDSRGKERDARWAEKLKSSEEARRELQEEIVSLKQELSGVHQASEQTLGEERRRTSTRSAELDKLRSELVERDATIERLNEALKLAAAKAEPEAEAELEEEDDLEKLRGIGPVLRRKLNAAGVRSFRQIASWTDDDLKRVASEVGTAPGRIRHDRWIEKAGELLSAKEG